MIRWSNRIARGGPLTIRAQYSALASRQQEVTDA